MTENKNLLDPLTQREEEILKHLVAGLTDKEIAAELFLSHNTVRWYNRQIYSKLGVSNRTQTIVRANELGLLPDTGSPTLSPPSRHVLPIATTPFIGRTHEIAEVKRLMQNARLLTLTGAGGIGKTRLALRVASEIFDTFQDGVYFVDLAPVDNHALVTKTIASVLGVFENYSEPLSDTLKRVIGEREILLVLDNFEHVMQAAALIADLLAASSRLKVLITSREALRLSGEQEYTLPRLSLPFAETVSIEDASASEAVTLFVQAAQMMQPHFALTTDNAAVIAQICARLDGLPLAIELAAARCKLLTPQALLHRLDNRLDVLASGSRDAPKRQQTLRDTIEWSYNLLNEDEKRLFSRLAVFRGGRSLEAIEAVCGDDFAATLLDNLASLVAKSLIQQQETTASEPRFVMLETIHEYARERLQESDEVETIQQRHAQYFVELVEHAEPELRLARQKYWFQLLKLERENIRAALKWTLSNDVTQGVRLAGALSFYWYISGYHAEGFDWTQQLLSHLNTVPEQFHAKFLIGAAHMMLLRNHPDAQVLYIRALEVSRRLGDKQHIALGLMRLGYLKMGEPDALSTAEAGLAVFKELDYKPGIAQALTVMGEIARFSGDDDHARSAYEAALVLYRHSDDSRGILVTYLNLSFIALREADYEGARNAARQALYLARELDLRAEMAECLIALAGTLGITGKPNLAARLFGAADFVLERLGVFFDMPDRPEFDRMITVVRNQPGATDFQAEWDEGRKMTLEQAIEHALEE